MPVTCRSSNAKSYIGDSIYDLPSPALLVNKKKVERNCEFMLNTVKNFGLKLRAQTKTHKTIEGARIQTGGSLRGLVVSTLDEAEFYADNGFDDILYGYPFIDFHLERCWKLAERLEEFHVMIDSETALQVLKENSPPTGKKWSIFVKIDAGNNRAGLWWEDEESIVKLASGVNQGEKMQLRGLYLHCGNSYKGQVQAVRDESIRRIVRVAEGLRAAGVPCPGVGVGSTPSCSHPTTAMKDLMEIHPGNYIFYDSQQESLGSCTFDQVACRVMTRVLGHYPHRNQLLIDCGFMALTKQGNLKTGFAVFQDNPNLKLVDMTQEIGKVEPLEGTMEYEKYPIGSVLFLYPYHACATAAMYPVYYIHEGDKVVEVWQPTRGW